jgi:hypothetical protein
VAASGFGGGGDQFAPPGRRDCGCGRDTEFGSDSGERGGWAGKYSQADLGEYEGEFKDDSFNGKGSAGGCQGGARDGVVDCVAGIASRRGEAGLLRAEITAHTISKEGFGCLEVDVRCLSIRLLVMQVQ